MKKFLLGLLLSGSAFAYTDAEKIQLLNRNMGPVANKVSLGSLIYGGAQGFVHSTGDSMTGNLLVVKSQHAHTQVTISNPDTTTSDFGTQSELQIAVSGVAVGSLKATAATLTGVTTKSLFLTTLGAFPIAFGLANSSTVAAKIDPLGFSLLVAGEGYGIKEGANARMGIATLSGTSTLVANTSLTANSRVFPAGVGATNVAPWLIGVSSGVGFSLGATGAGSAQFVIFEAQ